jgi:ubiquinone/menaquinone biosynthesis C-methylase UbiE
MSENVYNKIGESYSRHRRADSRIVDHIFRLYDLPAGSIIADIGAGTGNYSISLSERGYIIKAVEPSATMRNQAHFDNNIEWLEGIAEEIPLQDNSVDGVMCILSIHHFTSLEKAANEMARICKDGPILIFTFDPWQIERPWIAQYFPDIWDKAYKLFPPLSEIERLLANNTNRRVNSFTFELPHDLQDHFLAVGWRRPEIYLDPGMRACMSGFALADQNVVNEGVRMLQNDLDAGMWEKKHGYLRGADHFDLGYRFLCARMG